MSWLDRILEDARASGEARRREERERAAVHHAWEWRELERDNAQPSESSLVASPAYVRGQNSDGSWAVGTESLVGGVLYGQDERFASEEAAEAFVAAWNAHPAEWGGAS